MASSATRDRSPDTTWLRLAASPIYRSGNLFLRVDGGVDVPVHNGDGADADTLMRINVGGGFTTGAIAAMAELVTLGSTGDVGGSGDRFASTLALSVRGGLGGGVQGYGASSLPIDDYLENLIDYVVMFGVRIPLSH